SSTSEDFLDSRDQDNTWIQIDYYGLKGRFSPSDSAADEPQTWEDVLYNLNRHMRRLVDAVVGLPVDTIVGARNIIRSIGGVRDATHDQQAKKIRDTAIAGEANRQAEGLR